ncbi:MAG: DUF169 domain-containing protein [Chloroflexota bacterium]|nr:DUF169 domain-containing protein [Chloroflexota bacterium]
MDHREASEIVAQTYHLEGRPVAVSYVARPCTDGHQGKRFVCTAMQQARRGSTITLTARNVACPGGRHWLGLKNERRFLLPALTYGEKLFENTQVARQWFATVPSPPFGRARYVTLCPLDSAVTEPEMVFMVTDTHQAHRIHTALTFSDGALSLPHYFASTCQSAIGIPIATGKPYIALPDTACRKIARFADSDVLVGLPYRYFRVLLDNIDRSSGGTAVALFP